MTVIAVMGFFVSVKNIPTQTEYRTTYTFGISQTYAQGGNTNQSAAWQQNSDGKNLINEGFNTAISVLNTIAGILTIMITPLIMFAGWLMSPDWTTGHIFGIRKTIWELWVTVSNIVYFVYAVLLIVIALATIFNQKWFYYKALLPRLLLGIVLVPFTFGFVQTIIWLSTVVTGAALSIPAETMKAQSANEKETWWTKPIIPNTITAQTFKQTNREIVDGCTESTCTSPEKLVQKGGGIYGNLVIYAYWVFKVHEIKDLKSGNQNIEILKDLGWIVSDLMIGLIMFVVFWVLLVALTSMLFIRAFWLIIYTIVSPLFTLKFVLQDKWKLPDSVSVSNFLGTAFMPAVVGLVLSLGLVVVAWVRDSISTNQDGTKCNTIQATEWSPCVLLTIMGNPDNKIVMFGRESSTTGQGWGGWWQTKRVITAVQYGWISFEYEWSQQTEVNTDSNGGIMGIFGSMILQFIAIIVIWIAFMAAGKMSKVMEAVLRPFMELGGKVKSISAAVAQSTPIPFVGNIRGAHMAWDQVLSAIHDSQKRAFNNSAMGKMFHEKDIQRVTTAMDNLANAINKEQVNNLSSMPAKQLATTAWHLASSPVSDLREGNAENFGKILDRLNITTRQELQKAVDADSNIRRLLWTALQDGKMETRLKGLNNDMEYVSVYQFLSQQESLFKGEKYNPPQNPPQGPQNPPQPPGNP